MRVPSTEPRRWAPVVGLVLALLRASAGHGQPPAEVVPPGRAEPLRRASIVWLPGARVVLGASDEDRAYAEALCRRFVAGDDARRICPRERFADEGPAREVWVSAYGIDRFEVTVADWDRCVGAGRCPPARLPRGDPRVAHPQHPVGGVRFREAQGYCAFVGGRLPTEGEWERAARGAAVRARFPWGRFHDPRRGNHGARVEPDADGYRHAAPVGAFPDGASPHGVLDLAGNAREWTADRYDPDRRHVGPAVDPRGASSGGLRVVRGGSWLADPTALRVTARQPVPEDDVAVDLGFRCAYDIPGPRRLPGGGAVPNHPQTPDR